MALFCKAFLTILYGTIQPRKTRKRLTLNQLVLGSSPSRGTNFAKEIAASCPFRLARMLAVVSNVVTRRLKWWGCFATLGCARVPVPAPRKCCAKGIVEQRAGFVVFHHVSADDSSKPAAACALHSGSGLGAS